MLKMELFALLIAICCLIVVASDSVATLSKTSTPNEEWSAISSSYSGEQFFAVTMNAGIFQSNNFGYNWIMSLNSSATFYSVACTYSGQYVLAAAATEIYLSIDSGLTWSTSYFLQNASFQSVALSSDAHYLYAASYEGGIYASYNVGNNWIKINDNNLEWNSIACSYNGSIVVATVHYGDIYVSSNYGATFNASTGLYNYWTAVCSDSSGRYLGAAQYLKGSIYISNDYGQSWIKTNAPLMNWVSIASDSTGQYLYAAYDSNTQGDPYGGVFYSEDFGDSWVMIPSASSLKWSSITASGNGQYVAGSVYNGAIYASLYWPTSSPSNKPTSMPSTQLPTSQPSIIPSAQPSSNPTIDVLYEDTLTITNAPNLLWESATSSSSGQFIFAVSQEDGIYVSSDYGYNWFKSTAPSYGLLYSAVTCSSSGQIVYASLQDSVIITSTDFGHSWNATNSPNTKYYSIVSSGSGQFVYATCEGGIYRSSDYGSSWVETHFDDTLNSIACSKNGQYVATVSYGFVFFSNNYATNFSVLVISSATCVATDATGQYVTVGTADGYVFNSKNYGLTYTHNNIVYGEWIALSASSTGQFVYGVTKNAGVFYSYDYGTSWSKMNSLILDWTSITTSSSGQYVFATVYGGIYANLYTPTSQPSSVPSGLPTSLPSSPTSWPTLIPTGEPSSQPSAYPTYFQDTLKLTQTVQSSVGTNSYVFNNLGCDSTAYLSVTVIVSYLDSDSNGYINITAGSGNNAVLVDENCAPRTTCGSIACAVNVDVTDAITCNEGGSLVLHSETVNANHQTGIQSVCTYEGVSDLQYVLAYTVSFHPVPTASPTFSPTEGGNFVFNASPNLPFFVIALVTLLYIAVGVFLVRMREKSIDSKVFAEISLISTCFDLGMSGYHLAAEIFYLIVLFSDKLEDYGAVILSIRLCSCVLALYFCIITLGPVQYSKSLDSLLNTRHLYSNMTSYAGVVILMLLDHKFIRYFPWNRSEYVQLSGGFPNKRMFNLCMIPKLMQLLSTLMIQLLVLGMMDGSLFDQNDKIALALVMLYLVSSLITLVLFIIAYCVRLKVNDDTKIEFAAIAIRNPLGSSSTNLSDANPNETSRIQYLEERETLLTRDNALFTQEITNLKSKLESLEGNDATIQELKENLNILRAELELIRSK